MKPSVVLLSGGLDSATCLAIAHRDQTLPHALTIIYGQRHETEVEAARRVAEKLGVTDHKFVSIDLRAIGGSSLTSDVAVPKDGMSLGTQAIPNTYVPARNTIFLAIAMGYAETIGAESIYAGMNAVDYSGYPDCRPEFVTAFQQLARVATKSGVEGSEMEIRAPLMHLKKPEIIRMGLQLGVDYSITQSCYDPGSNGACGQCDSCRIRLAAFAELGLQDPAVGARGST